MVLRFKPERVRPGIILLAGFGAFLCLSSSGKAQVFNNGKACWPGSVCSDFSFDGEEGTAVRKRPRRAVTRVKQKAASLKSEPPPANDGRAKAQASAPAAHRVGIQVDQNDKAIMDLALNNVRNIVDYYKAKGETVAIEVVTYGPGLHMLRADTSPVKERIAPMALENPNVAFIACGNTQANQSKAEGKPVALISEAKVMPSGVVRLMELQKQGYAYIRP